MNKQSNSIKITENTTSEDYKKKKEQNLELTLNHNIEDKVLALENKEDTAMHLNTLSFVMAPSHNISDIQKNDKLSTFRVCPTNTPFKEKSDLILLPSPFRIEEGKGDDIPITDRDKSEKSIIDSLAGLSVKFSNSQYENNKFDHLDFLPIMFPLKLP